MLICHALGRANTARLANYTAAIVLLTHSGDPWPFAFYRLVETLIGIGFAVAVSLVPKMVKEEPSSPES